jgi:hypothetical protein
MLATSSSCTEPQWRPAAPVSKCCAAIRDDWSHWNISISLRVCELPHIAREAFVVKYPREQDHFRHTNWRTGDGSSPRLETCRNWKNFQRLWATFTTHHSTRRSDWEFSRWTPGAEATAAFTDRFKNGDGGILNIIKVPLSNPDFAPFLQHARSDDENTFSHHSA